MPFPMLQQSQKFQPFSFALHTAFESPCIIRITWVDLYHVAGFNYTINTLIKINNSKVQFWFLLRILLKERCNMCGFEVWPYGGSYTNLISFARNFQPCWHPFSVLSILWYLIYVFKPLLLIVQSCKMAIVTFLHYYVNIHNI